MSEEWERGPFNLGELRLGFGRAQPEVLACQKSTKIAYQQDRGGWFGESQKKHARKLVRAEHGKGLTESKMI